MVNEELKCVARFVKDCIGLAERKNFNSIYFDI